MNPRPPIISVKQELPFWDSAFTWQTFEAFFCDFLNGIGGITIADEGISVSGSVIRARPFGRPGDAQFGIDILADMEGGDVWDFQCKHVEEWTPEKTRKAIAAYKRTSAQKFLLVTCDVSEACHEIIAENPGWALWDGREITRRFREMGAFKGGPILFTHFGPSWSEAFFGVSGNSPLLAAEAKFQQQLREGRRFHHRYAHIGREDLLQRLDEFVRDEKARVFLFTGRGGLGKSRLLLEWSRHFSEQHPVHILRFAFDKATDFGPSLQVAPKPLVIVLDDAHRLDDVRQLLIPELPNRAGIKLVLALRPGPQGQVRQELLEAGFDDTEIVTAEPMKPLDGEQTMKLVDAALRGRFPHLRNYLQSAARNCPLVAVLGAELVLSGALNEADLRDTAEVESRVYKSLLRDADDVRQKFGAAETDDFLRIIALLGPVKLDAAFFEKAAPFLGLRSPDHVSRLRDSLDEVGLLLTSGAGTRVTPDLLSDHLAYDACYDNAGQSRTFAERLLESFSWEQFPKLMQHLAEAEWRAGEKSSAASVVEPLWQKFRERFENSSFWERREQLHQWMNIAHLQPERTLKLAELALSLKTQRKFTDEEREVQRQLSLNEESNDHAKSLAWLTQMIGPVAEHHPEYVARCFDLLWTLGKDDLQRDFNNNKSHAFSVIHDVMTFTLWKTLDLYDAALTWIERLMAGDEWLRCKNSPAVILERFLHPLFATSIGNNWSSGRTIHIESHPLNLERTAFIRERARALFRGILARNDNKLASYLIPTLERCTEIARIGFGNPAPAKYSSEWDEERLKCLTLIEELIRDFSNPVIHFQIRRALLKDIRCGTPDTSYWNKCKYLLASIPDTLELRLCRATCGREIDEFARDTKTANWIEIEQAKWRVFVQSVADEVFAKFPEVWFDHLASINREWAKFAGIRPNFREVIMRIADQHPSEGIRICERLTNEPEHSFIEYFDAALMPATKGKDTVRVALIKKAAAASEQTGAAAVACCSWWRHEGVLPEEIWEMLSTLATSHNSAVAERIASFVWWGNNKYTIRDWNLVTSIPFSADQPRLISEIISRIGDIIEDGDVSPDAESVRAFLARLEPFQRFDGDYQFEHALEKIAKAYPVDVFLMLWRRNQRRKAGQKEVESLPFDFERISFGQIMDAPEVIAILDDAESRVLNGERLDFDEKRLLKHAISHRSEGADSWLDAALDRANTENHLQLIRDLASPHDTENPALAEPDFTRKLLSKARTISPICHEKIFRGFLHIGGARGTSNDQPDDGWKSLIESLERLAHQHATDPELGPLYSAMAKHERSWLESMKMRSISEDADE